MKNKEALQKQTSVDRILEHDESHNSDENEETIYYDAKSYNDNILLK